MGEGPRLRFAALLSIPGAMFVFNGQTLFGLSSLTGARGSNLWCSKL